MHIRGRATRPGGVPRDDCPSDPDDTEVVAQRCPPDRHAERAVRRHRRRDAGRPGDPRGHGLHQDRRDAGRSPACTRSSCRSRCSRCSARRGTSWSAPTPRRPRSWRSASSRLAPSRARTSTSQLASLTALMCAVLLILARLLKLGFIANFLSRSVLIGFLTGVGIQVAMGQVGGMFGVTERSRHHAREVRRDPPGDPDPDQHRRPSSCRWPCSARSSAWSGSTGRSRAP